MAFDKVIDSTKLDGALTDIADAIRTKTGGTDSLTLEQMPREIEGIETGKMGKPYVDTSKITNFGDIFQNNNFPVDELQNIDTKNVTKFNYMFSGCSTLTTIPLLDTSNGTSFQNMFGSCSALTTIPLLDTSNGTNFEYMFNYCSKLTTIPLLDTSNGTSFNAMFQGCSRLTAIPLLDTSNGTKFDYMFSGCSALTTIPLMDTSNGTSFRAMFTGCSALSTIPLLDTSNGTIFAYMFYRCPALTTIPLLDTSNGTDFSGMFQNCSSLTKVPLLDMSKATDCEAIFYNCANLTDLTIKVNSLKPNYYMFDYCSALTNVTIEGTIKITNNSFRIDYSDNLTVESIMNFINAFEDNSSLSTTYTVYFGKTNLDKLTDEQKAVATAKNIALA